MTNRLFRLSLPGLIVLAVHTFLVLYMLLVIALDWHYGSGEGVMMWFLIYWLDFPSSWLAFKTAGLLDAVAGDHLGQTAANVYVPALVFAFWGGIQYYLTAAVVGALARLLFGAHRRNAAHRRE
jgi:hypothetical protein